MPRLKKEEPQPIEGDHNRKKKNKKLLIYPSSYYYNVYKNNDYLINKIKAGAG